MQSVNTDYKDTIMLSAFAPKGFRMRLCKLFEIDFNQQGLWSNVYGVRNKQSGQITSFGATVGIKHDSDLPSKILRKAKYSAKTDEYTIQTDPDNQPVISSDNKQRDKLRTIIDDLLQYMAADSSESDPEK